MPEYSTKIWNEGERSFLDQILDQIIPASEDGKIPSAGSLGVAEFLAKKISAESKLSKLFRQGMLFIVEQVNATGKEFNSLTFDDWHTITKALEEKESIFFQSLLRYTYMGYYSNATIRSLFGLSENPPHPDGYEVPLDDSEELEAFVAPVKKRGQCFREC